MKIINLIVLCLSLSFSAVLFCSDLRKIGAMLQHLNLDDPVDAHQQFMAGGMSVKDCHEALCAKFTAGKNVTVRTSEWGDTSAARATTELDPGQRLMAEISAKNIAGMRALLQTTKPTGLHLSRAVTTSLDAVLLLLTHNAPMEDLDEDNITPLGRAVLTKNHDATLALCRYGASVNARMRSDTTALHAAAIAGCPFIIVTLLSYGADPTIKDYLGRTPLHRAVEKKQTMAIGLLLGTGKALDEKDNAGLTPLDYAHKYNNAPAEEVLQEKLATAASAHMQP